MSAAASSSAPVGAIAPLVGAQIVDLLHVLAIDGREGDEFQNVDGARRLLLERLELLGRQDHVLILGELVSFNGVVARHDLVFLGAYVLLLEARAALLVEHVEGDARLGFGRRVDADGDRDEAEGDRGGSY